MLKAGRLRVLSLDGDKVGTAGASLLASALRAAKPGGALTDLHLDREGNDLDEEAEKLALEIAGDKVFRGEFAGKAYIMLAGIYRKQAEKAASPDAKAELLKKAHGTYQRVYVANQSVPEVAAEAYWQAYETALALSNTDLANETLKALAANPKLKNTARAKKAVELAK